MFQNNNKVTSVVSWVLRLEGLMVFIAALFIYQHAALASWKLFLLLFFLPDIGLLGYLGGDKLGSIMYNSLHNYIIPLSIGLLCYLLAFPNWNYFLLIWIAHIGFDRAFGFGLKYCIGFKYTHLSLLGKKKIKES